MERGDRKGVYIYRDHYLDAQLKTLDPKQFFSSEKGWLLEYQFQFLECGMKVAVRKSAIWFFMIPVLVREFALSFWGCQHFSKLI